MTWKLRDVTNGYLRGEDFPTQQAAREWLFTNGSPPYLELYEHMIQSTGQVGMHAFAPTISQAPGLVIGEKDFDMPEDICRRLGI